MKWLKHDSDAHCDTKMKKLRLKYGMEGYGLYWYILELIARNITKERLTFDLEDDAEIIAHDTGIHQSDVEEMMMFMVGIGLFEEDQGLITCLKLARRLDDATSRHPGVREIQEGLRMNSEETPKKLRSATEDSSARLDKIRLDKNIKPSDSDPEEPPKKPKKEFDTSKFDAWWAIYPVKAAKKKVLGTWKSRNLDSKFDMLVADVKNRLENDARWKNGFAPNPTTYLNQDRWEDDVVKQDPVQEKIDSAWMRDDQALLQKCDELDIHPGRGELYPELRKRVAAKLRV